MSDLFLMSPPGPHWQLRGRTNFRSASAPAVDAARARAEWDALVDAIERAGGRVAVLPPDDSLTGMPFCAEAGHPLPAVAHGRPRFLLSAMRAEHRRAERAHWRPFVARLGFAAVDSASEFWEGQGDVATFRGVPLLFYGGRTDRAGLASVRSYFADDALELAVREPAFHGNVAVLPVDACDRLVVCPNLIAGDSIAVLRARFGDDAIVPIATDAARAYATNALPIGDALLAPSVTPPEVFAPLQRLGIRVTRLTMTELCEKAGGAARCLVCRIPAAIAAQLSPPTP